MGMISHNLVTEMGWRANPVIKNYACDIGHDVLLLCETDERFYFWDVGECGTFLAVAAYATARHIMDSRYKRYLLDLEHEKVIPLRDVTEEMLGGDEDAWRGVKRRRMELSKRLGESWGEKEMKNGG